MAITLQVFAIGANPYISSRWLPRYEHPPKEEVQVEIPQETETESFPQDFNNEFSVEIENPDSAVEAIKDAGFTMQNDEDLLVRGQVARTTNVYIDGVLSNDPLTGEFDFGLLDSLKIESIKIVEGDVSSAYNHCVSIYIKTKAQKGFSFETGSKSNFSEKAVWFSDNYAKASYGFDIGKTDFVISAAADYNQNKFYYRSLAINKYRQQYSLYQDKFCSIGTAVQFFNSNATGKVSFRNTNYATDFIGSTSLDYEKLDFAISAQHTKIDGGSYTQASANVTTKFDLPFGFCIEPKALFEAGHIETSLGNKYDLTGIVFAKSSWEYKKKIYFQTEITPKLYLSKFGVVPSVAGSLTWGIKNHGLLAKAGLLYCKPNLQQLYWNDGVTKYVGNPNLKSESGWHTELNYFYKNTFSKISVATYFSRVVNSIHAVTFEDIIRYENSSDGIFFGGTLRLDLFPCEWLTLNLLYENVNPYVSQDLRLDSGDKQIMWTYKNRVWVNAGFDFGAADFFVSGEYVDKRPTTNTNMLWIPSYFLVETGVKVPFKWGSFSTSFISSLGKPWQETTLNPMPENQLAFRFECKF